MKIKICGLTKEEEAQYLNRHQVDYAGMVLFFPKSKRNITIDQAKQIMAALSDGIQTVAVVVEPDLGQVRQIEEAGFDYIQIHGKLPEHLLEQIQIPVLKAFNVKDMEQYERFHNSPQVAGYVFDAQEPGSGEVFDWSLVTQIPRDDKLFLLAGGLQPENVAEAIRYVRPDGVDVSSGVEYTKQPGKDPKKVERFVQEVRTYDGRMDI